MSRRSTLAIGLVVTLGLLGDPASMAVAGAPSTKQAQAGFEITDVMSAALPTNLTASPDGSAVAWVLDERGARNVWVAEAPEFVGRRLTDYTRDDGQEITNLQFAAGGRVVFVRGGSPNRAGELPNPLSYANGVAREIFAAPLAGGDPRLIAVGSGPVVSPDGTNMVYRGGGALRIVSLAAPDESADGDGPESTLALDARGGAGSVRFSPDGSRIAFVSNRGTHSFVGVVEIAADDGSGPREVRWIDPSVDSDAVPVWSPDGRRIAFVRTPARRGAAMFAPMRTARPWSIHVADADGATSEVVFTAAEGAGSVLQGVGMPYHPSASGGLVWGAGDRLAFAWERGGWKGMYSVPVSGGDAVPIAAGEFEIETALRSADGSELLLTSNESDIDRRHIWRAPIDGSAPATRLTAGDWIEWSPVPVGDALAFMRSNGTFPAQAVIRIPGAEPRALAPGAVPVGFPSEQLVEPQQVIFPGADGMAIHGQLFLPPGANDGQRRPAVLFFHGGSRRQMLLGFHYIGYYHNAYAMNQYLASRGYVVLSVNYRSGIGYGMEFREALNYGATGGSEFNDVLGAGLYMAKRDDVDPERIGLWGGSYGGYLTAMGLSRASDLFAAGVDIHGVHDWNDGIRIFNPGYDPDEETERLAFESSPNASLDTWRSPVLLIHGDDDRNVFFSQTVYLTEELRDRGVHVETLVFPDEVHGFLLHRNWLRAFEAAADFFDRMMGPPAELR